LKGGLKVSVVTELEGDVFIYIPPSDILIAINPIVSSALNNFRGTIIGIESQRQIISLTINIGILIEALITRKSREELQLEFGKEVYVAWKASAVHVFKEIENE